MGGCAGRREARAGTGLSSRVLQLRRSTLHAQTPQTGARILQRIQKCYRTIPVLSLDSFLCIAFFVADCTWVELCFLVLVCCVHFARTALSVNYALKFSAVPASEHRACLKPRFVRVPKEISRHEAGQRLACFLQAVKQYPINSFVSSESGLSCWCSLDTKTYIH